MFGRRAADPMRLNWNSRLAAARPGLQALGIDPDLPPSDLQFRLMRSDNIEGGELRVGGRTSLLGANHKTDKSKELSPERQARLDAYARGLSVQGILTGGLLLSPDVESGIEVCARSTNCAKTCLAWDTGRNRGGHPQRARVRKTLFWWLFPEMFLRGLEAELGLLKWTAVSEGMLPAVRLNVGSDIPWERAERLFDAGVPAYDYTKLPWKLRQPHRPNYHLTYSLSEAEGSLHEALQWLEQGGNAAVVVGPAIAPKVEEKLLEIERAMLLLRGRGEVESPAWVKLRNERSKLLAPGKGHATALRSSAALLDRGDLWGFPVVSGDDDDARFLDPPGHWVVLAAKGPALFDQTGFVVRITEDGLPVETPAQHIAREVPWSVLKQHKADFRQHLSPVARMSDEVAPQFIDIGVFKRPTGVSRGRRDTACFNLPIPFDVDPWGNRLR